MNIIPVLSMLKNFSINCWHLKKNLAKKNNGQFQKTWMKRTCCF